VREASAVAAIRLHFRGQLKTVSGLDRVLNAEHRRGSDLLEAALNLFRRKAEKPGLAFSRPLVVLQSDDWGRVGIRDRDGYDWLRSRGIRLGERAYDLYSLETAGDVTAVAALLGRHRDSTGRPPCMVMNVCTANLDFKKMREGGFKRVETLPLAKGLPGSWSRPGLFESYRAGMDQGVFYPALHGTTHFCPVAVENALAEGGERAEFLRLLWEAETPYIYWRMPWIGYEYSNPEKPHAGFLSAERQGELIRQAQENFTAMFGTQPFSACAPGCRANNDTHRAWAEAGIRIAENGSGNGLRAPHVDEFGVLHLYRTIDFEPSHQELDIEKYLQIAGSCFARGLPVIISVHSINFHSSLKDFRTPSLAALDSLLSGLESKHPELLYVHDEDLYGIVTQGAFLRGKVRVDVAVNQGDWNSRFAAQGAV
jgi:hypothetical protein